MIRANNIPGLPGLTPIPQFLLSGPRRVGNKGTGGGVAGGGYGGGSSSAW